MLWDVFWDGDDVRVWLVRRSGYQGGVVGSIIGIIHGNRERIFVFWGLGDCWGNEAMFPITRANISWE